MRSKLYVAGVVPAAAIAVVAGMVAYYSTRIERTAPYQEWVNTSAQAHENLFLAAPLVAAFAAAHSGSLFDHRSLVRIGMRDRGAPKVAAISILWIGGIVSAGYLSGLLPLIIRTAETATAGGPDWRAIATAPAMLIACSAFGVLLGSTLPRMVSPVIAGGITYVFGTASIYGGDGWWGVSPYQEIIPRPGQFESPALADYRLFSLAAIAVSAFVVTAFSVKAATRGTREFVAAATLGAATAATLVVVPVVRVPQLFELESNPQRICGQSSADVSVCLHQAHQPDFQSVKEATDQILRTYGHVPARGVRVIDSSLLMGAGHLSSSTVPIHILPGRSDGAAVASNALTNYLSGANACITLGVAGQTAPGEDLSDAISRWLGSSLGMAVSTVSDLPGSSWGGGAAETDTFSAGPLSTYDQEAVRAHIRTHSEAILGCQLPLTEFEQGIR